MGNYQHEANYYLHVESDEESDSAVSRTLLLLGLLIDQYRFPCIIRYLTPCTLIVDTPCQCHTDEDIICLP